MSGLIIFFRQLFCDHIWKTVKIEDLNKTWVQARLYWDEVHRSAAVHQECIKCNKTRTIEQSSAAWENYKLK